jgi:hypothetical protein
MAVSNSDRSPKWYLGEACERPAAQCVAVVTLQALEAQTTGALNQPLSDLPVRRIARSDPRRRAARVAAARRGVQIHLTAYLAASLLMIGIWLTLAITVAAWYFWPVWPIVGGGIGVISHAIPVRSCTRDRRS